MTATMSVAAERDRVDRDRRVERLRDRVAGQGERAGQEQGTGREQLGEPDRRDREDEPRRAREATDDHQLDERSEHEGGDEADSEPGPPAESDGAHGEQHRERRRHGTEVAGSEVDHTVRAPHDGEAEREERAQPADDRALHEHAERHVECHAGDADDENGDCSRNQQPPGARRAFGHAVVVVTKSTTTRASSGPRSSWRKWPPPSIVVCGCPWQPGMCSREGAVSAAGDGVLVAERAQERASSSDRVPPRRRGSRVWPGRLRSSARASGTAVRPPCRCRRGTGRRRPR